MANITEKPWPTNESIARSFVVFMFVTAVAKRCKSRCHILGSSSSMYVYKNGNHLTVAARG